MSFLNKIWAFARKKKQVTEYSRGSFILLCVQFYIYGVGLDLTGLKIYSIDVQAALSMFNSASFYGFEYAYYCAIHGLFLGLAVFRLFELYWWAKDVNNSLYTVSS